MAQICTMCYTCECVQYGIRMDNVVVFASMHVIIYVYNIGLYPSTFYLCKHTVYERWHACAQCGHVCIHPHSAYVCMYIYI